MDLKSLTPRPKFDLFPFIYINRKENLLGSWDFGIILVNHYKIKFVFYLIFLRNSTTCTVNSLENGKMC